MIQLIQDSVISIHVSGLVDTLTLLMKTVQLRPYVFLFLAGFVFSATRLVGWPRTGVFFSVVLVTAFVCEFSSTRTGIPFGWYHYTGSTVGQELYLSNIPFMASLSFTMLLYASYCLALSFLLPSQTESARQNQYSGNGRFLALTFDRSVGVTGRPMVPREDLRVPRSRPPFRRPCGQLRWMGGGGSDRPPDLWSPGSSPA